MKDGWVLCGEKKDERERKEREIWQKNDRKGSRTLSYFHPMGVWALKLGHLGTYPPESIILQHSQHLGTRIGRLGAQFLFFFFSSTPLKYHHILIYILKYPPFESNKNIEKIKLLRNQNPILGFQYKFLETHLSLNFRSKNERANNFLKFIKNHSLILRYLRNNYRDF